MNSSQLDATKAEAAEKPAPSYRNMIRYGFKVAHVRPNYLLEFSD